MATKPMGIVEIANHDGCCNRYLPATRLMDIVSAHVQSQVGDDIAGATMTSVMADNKTQQTAPIIDIVLFRDRSLNELATPAKAMHAGIKAIAKGSRADGAKPRRW